MAPKRSILEEALFHARRAHEIREGKSTENTEIIHPDIIQLMNNCEDVLEESIQKPREETIVSPIQMAITHATDNGDHGSLDGKTYNRKLRSEELYGQVLFENEHLSSC